MTTGLARTHKQARQKLRRRLTAEGLDPAEIAKQVEALGAQQLAKRLEALPVYARGGDIGPPEERLAAGKPVPKGSQRHIVIARDGFWCRYCGTPVELDLGRGLPARSRLTIDHVTPRSRGGSNWASNRVVACSWCNGCKGSYTLEEWGRPLLPPRGLLLSVPKEIL